MKLLDFISLEDLQKIQDSFAFATGVGACIHELDGIPITEPSNWCEFCVNYNRKSKIGFKRCKASDKLLGERAIKSGKPAIGYCGNGHLIDAVAPIFVEDKNVAIVTCGQVLYRKPNLEDYRKIARELNVDEDGYIEALKKVTIMSKERFKCIINLMYQLANVISSLSFQRLEEKRAKEDREISLSAFRDILSEVAKGDLSSKVDLDIIPEDFRTVGEDINTTIENIQKNKSKLEESRVYFQNFFNSSPVPLTRIGLDGKRLDCNPAMEELTGRRREELVGVPVEEAYPEEKQELVRKKLIDETIEKDSVYDFEIYFLRPDGIKLPIVANTALVRDKDGKPSSIIYSATDISELKKREEELEEMRKLLERETAKIAASIVENLRRISQMATPGL
jgi:PAS domain S-box-containing protein